MYSFLTEEIINSNNIIKKNKNVKLNLMEKKIVYNLSKKFNYLTTDIDTINNDRQNDLEEFVYFQNKLKSELKKQFYNDGTSFEGSSHYAAFVTEALIICKLSVYICNHNLYRLFIK